MEIRDILGTVPEMLLNWQQIYHFYCKCLGGHFSSDEQEYAMIGNKWRRLII